MFIRVIGPEPLTTQPGFGFDKSKGGGKYEYSRPSKEA